MWTRAGLSMVPFLSALLWRLGEPPVLLFAAGFQWLQVFLPVVIADRDQFVMNDWWMQIAAWLGLGTLIILGAGMRLGCGRRPIMHLQDTNAEDNQLSVSRLAWAYGLTFLLGQAITEAVGLVPGLRQQLLALGGLRWTVIFLVGWAALRDARYRLLAVLVLLIEVALGFSGYFGGFKTVLYLAVVLLIGSGIGVRKVLRPALLPIVLAAVLLTSFWQAVKDDYRFFLNQGERAQVVRVSLVSRFSFLL